MLDANTVANTKIKEKAICISMGKKSYRFELIISPLTYFVFTRHKDTSFIYQKRTK